MYRIERNASQWVRLTTVHGKNTRQTKQKMYDFQQHLLGAESQTSIKHRVEHTHTHTGRDTHVQTNTHKDTKKTEAQRKKNTQNERRKAEKEGRKKKEQC